MKILYITIPSFFDLEISLIRELSQLVEVQVIMVVNPISRHSSAFSINTLPKDVSLKRFCEVEELVKYNELIDTSKWLLASINNNGFFDNFRLSKLIGQFADDYKPNLIHMTSVAKNSLTLLPFIYKYKKLLTLHDPIPHSKLSWFQNISRNLILRSCQNILLLSKSQERQFVAEYGFKGCKIYHSRLSIYDFLLHIDTDKIETPENYILFFGRIDEYKGVDVLIESYINSKLSNEGIKLVIAGKGSIYLSENMQSRDNIIFYNRYIENEELSRLIRCSKFVVLPYKSATQSGCLFSSFAFGKPVIATTVGDLCVEVENEKTGLLVAPMNVEKLTKGLEQMAFRTNLSEMETNINNLYNGSGNRSWIYISTELIGTYKNIIQKSL